ncbi:MAG: MauE/DoxX family redox-associated membrane protein [Elusimicrobiota bacterium]
MKEPRAPSAPPTPRLPAWSGLAGRFVVGLVLVISGSMKAAAPPEEFSIVIEGYQLLRSQDLILMLATFMPWAEVVLGFALIFGYLTRAAAASAGALLLVFIGALLSAKARGLYLPNCGCFGAGFHPTPLMAIGIDAVLVGFALLAYRSGTLILSLDNWCGEGYTKR